MTDTRLVALDDVRGPLDDFMGKLVGDEGHSLWLPAFKRFLRKENPWELSQAPAGLIVSNPVPKTYPTPFVPGLTWKQRIERWKQFDSDYIDPEIWKCIDSFVDAEEEDASAIDIELDPFGNSMSSSGVESFQAKNGKKMISPARFLSLCETYPDLQREDPIVCTQKICVNWDGDVRVLFTDGNADRRRLCLSYYDVVRDWNAGCRFPSTRNVS